DWRREIRRNDAQKYPLSIISTSIRSQRTQSGGGPAPMPAWRNKMRVTALLTACITFVAFASDVQAADPHGIWQTEGGKAQVRLADCGGALCGTIIGLSEPNNPATGRPKTDENNPD